MRSQWIVSFCEACGVIFYITVTLARNFSGASFRPVESRFEIAICFSPSANHCRNGRASRSAMQMRLKGFVSSLCRVTHIRNAVPTRPARMIPVLDFD
jgi:hypothetical protein